ncbi:MAG: hypothetical protein H6747_16715 [Deltaproteobacteria bacterium]|nr:hypothetical protein [Deltaproteobacteria bacterium]
MREVSGRRLTGPNRWLDAAGVAVVVRDPAFVADRTHDAAFAAFRGHVLAAYATLGWAPPHLVCSRRATDDPARAEAVWAATGPLDRLYAATALCEAAAAQDATHQSCVDAAHAEEDVAGDARLLALQQAAEDAGLPFLWDDDALSLGWGPGAQVWARDEAPAAEDASDAVRRALAARPPAGRIPVAMITGTNGKTTTTRMLARMARTAGRCVGATSTDGLTLDGALVERGDWTGPGGARTVLRDPRVELAVLETARGGLLRRGLSTEGVDAAAVTNVSDDHLGEWGIDDVAAMAEVKLLVARAVRPAGRLVLRDDPLLRAAAETARLAEGVRVLWLRSDDAGGQGVVAWLEDADGAAPTLVVDCGGAHGDRPALRIPASAVPLCIGGAARHNVENALCAALLARGLDLPDEAIAAGLAALRPAPDDSPGRSNLFRLNGARVLLDFGHNPDGVRRVAEMAARVPASRRLVVIGQAGDRTDDEIAGLVDGLLACRPERWLLKAMPKVARGRPEGEVVALLQRTLAERGVAPDAVTVHPSEDAAALAALDALQPGDLLLLLAHENPPAVLARVLERAPELGWS